MAFTRPTLKQIDERIRDDISARMGSQASFLRRAWVNVFARAYAGAVHLLYGFLEWSYRQFFATTAEREALIEKAKVYGLSLKTAQYAVGYVRVSGTNGVLIPIGTVFKRSDGYRYTSDIAATISGSVADVHVKANLAGIAGNLPSGSPVSLESPIAGILNAAVVSASTPGPIESGSEEEDVEAFRSRFLLRVQKPPQGGSKSDYETWALEVPGVGGVTVYGPSEIVGPYDGPDLDTTPDHPLSVGQSVAPPYGQVWVYVKSTDPNNPTPSNQVVIDVQTYLEMKKPLTAIVQTFGIVNHPVTFQINISLNQGYSEAEARDEIVAELQDLFLRVGRPYTTIPLSQINEAISNAASEFSHVLIAPVADVVLAYNELPTVQTPIGTTVI